MNEIQAAFQALVDCVVKRNAYKFLSRAKPTKYDPIQYLMPGPDETIGY